MSYNLGRDELFWRIGHEKSDDLLNALKNSENVNFKDEEGTSYLRVACINHYLEAIIVLLENGADPNVVDKKGHTAILAALGSKHKDNSKILETFLKHGLDLNRIHKSGETLKCVIQSFGNEEWNNIIQEFGF